MPLYEFQCPKGHITSWIVSVDTPTLACAKCANEGVRSIANRILSPTRTTFQHADTKLKL